MDEHVDAHLDDVTWVGGTYVTGGTIPRRSLVVAHGVVQDDHGLVPLWWSPSGWFWNRVDAADVTGSLPRTVSDLLAARDTFIASGTNRAGAPSTWWSADGRRWHEVRIATMRRGHVSGITVTTYGMVLLGQTGGPWGHPFVATSIDGCEWHPVVQPAVFDGAGGQYAYTLREEPDGLLVLDGVEHLTRRDYTRPVTWVSRDGTAWARVPDPAYGTVPRCCSEPDPDSWVEGPSGVVHARADGQVVLVPADGDVR